MPVMETHAWLSVGISTSGWNKGCPFPHCLCHEVVKRTNCFLRRNPILASSPGLRAAFIPAPQGTHLGVCLVALRPLGSSQIRDQTHVSCTDRRIFFFFFLPLSHQGSSENIFNEKSHTQKEHILYDTIYRKCPEQRQKVG